MDVALLTASFSAAYCLPLQDSVQASKSVRAALGLSLSLFSLSIIEVAPSQSLFIFDNVYKDGRLISPLGNITVAAAYELVLSTFCIGIAFIVPILVGRHFFSRLFLLGCYESSDDKRYLRWKSLPWLMRYMIEFTALLLKILFRIILMVWKRLCIKSVIDKILPPKQAPILVLTNSQHGVSRHGSSKANAGSLSKWLIGGGAGVLIATITLKTMGSLVVSLSGDGSPTLLSTVISWICAVGLVISSTLNGFGSVSMPYRCLAGLFLKPIRPEVVAKAEMELCSTKSSIESKLVELQSDFSADEQTNRRRASVHTGTKRAFADFNSDERSNRNHILHQEVDFLQSLFKELEEDIQEMKYAQEQAALARTTTGKIRSYIGLIFSIILLIRLFTASKSILYGYYHAKRQMERDDPITSCLLWMIGRNLVSDRDYNILSQGISLLLTAVLSLSQINTFLRTITAMNRRISFMYDRCNCKPRKKEDMYSAGKLFGNSFYYNIHTCLLASCMGCYFVSCVVLTKMNLPSQYRSSFSAALGGMEYNIRTTVVNLVFCASAGTSVAILSLLFGIQRQNTKRYADETIDKGRIEV